MRSVTARNASSIDEDATMMRLMHPTDRPGDLRNEGQGAEPDECLAPGSEGLFDDADDYDTDGTPLREAA